MSGLSELGEVVGLEIQVRVSLSGIRDDCPAGAVSVSQLPLDSGRLRTDGSHRDAFCRLSLALTSARRFRSRHPLLGTGVSSQYPHRGFPFPASTGPPRPCPQDPAPEPLPGSGSFHLTRSLACSHRCGCCSVSISGPRLSPELQVVHCRLGERTAPSPRSPPRRRPHRPACKLLPLFSWPLFLVSQLFISGRSFPGFHRATS